VLRHVSKRAKPLDEHRIDWNALATNSAAHLKSLLQHSIEHSPHAMYLGRVSACNIVVLERVATKIEQFHPAIIEVDEFQPAITQCVL